MQHVGRINLAIFKSVSDEIETDEVVITETQIAHIKERHPLDYERYAGYIPKILKEPDYILEDSHPDTAFILKEFAEADERFQMIVRLKTSRDPADRQNSIITFLRLGETRYEQYLRNKKYFTSRNEYGILSIQYEGHLWW